jgi:hypothetical protein
VDRRIGGIRLWAPYYTIANQTTVQFAEDVLDIVSCIFSMGNANAENNGSSSPFAQGALVYPMTLLEQAAFMDAAAGFPAVGFGPPQAGFIYQDTGYNPSTPIAPPPQPQLVAVPDGSSAFLDWNVSNWNQAYWGPQGSGFQQTLEVVQTYVNAFGETTQSPVADITLQPGQGALTQSPPSFGNVTGYNDYAGLPGGPYFLQNPAPIPIGQTFIIPDPFFMGGVQPPTVNTATGSGTGGALSMQLYPAAMIGQVNIYYRARPQLWADTTDTSWTNMDSSAQEAVVLFAVSRVLAIRQRTSEWVAVWKPEYESMVDSLKESIARRTQPKSGQVRDVWNRSFPSSPFWLAGR